MKYIIDIPEDIRVAISQMGLLRIPDEMIRVVDEAIQHSMPLDKYRAESGDLGVEKIEVRKPCINYEDGCEEWAGCPCVHYKGRK